eukprot:CAMPEP_0116852076 /NCGR_PEP_ID=MMETSP0418-20121206/17090_1 /TAXON_ID=1158023 /ORGANISM="Astrosyne radiata, Strain 13vi08-1A" /LENGTH=284 /DNA_ID=CAMNT_0004484195 /DNA_START=293 /DNA_END=1147 /DNA_ORIENTATION=+
MLEGSRDILQSKANRRDLVTESDLACQECVRSALSEAFPNDRFLGEEDVGAGSLASQESLRNALDIDGEATVYLWIVDPIDGTTNFQAGLPLYCVSIGLVSIPNCNSKQQSQRPERVLGVVYNPVLGEMVSAVKGRGAYVNGKRLIVGETSSSPLSQSIINIGFPVVQEATLQASAKAVAALALQVRALRMIACASQAMVWVAQDKIQSYTSWDLNAWDVCAGIVIVEEAGGCVVDMRQNDDDDDKDDRNTLSIRDMIVCSPSGGTELGESIRRVLEENDCIDY